MERTFFGYWTCDYCGEENRGDSKTCHGCGKTRGQDVKFYINPKGKSEPRKYVERREIGPDWHCSYCDSLNPNSESFCKNCGHPRDEKDKDYFDLHPERKGIKDESFFDSDIKPDHHREGFHKKEEPSYHYEPPSYDPSHLEEPPKRVSKRHYEPDNQEFRSRDYSGFIKKFAIFALILIVISSMVFLLMPTKRDLTIIDKTWERQVEVEEYRTLHEEDWSIPSGGRMTGSYRAIHHYEDVLDHYDTVTKSRTVPDGGHYESDGYTDNGDGTFTEHSHWVTDYKTEYYTEQEPVYRSEPVYQTKYQYDIERWVFDYYETTSGHDDEPYFASPKLDSRHRTGHTTETYHITATYEKRGKTITDIYTMDFASWKTVEIGTTIRAKVHVGKRIELIE